MENKKKKLSAYYKPYKGLFLADMVFAMIGAAITLVIPLMVRYITGTVVLLPIEEASSTIIRLGIFMVLLVIVEGYCNYFIGYYGHVMGAKIEHDMRNEIFAHYQKLSFAFLIIRKWDICSQESPVTCLISQNCYIMDRKMWSSPRSSWWEHLLSC